jgi:putative flippase GtrA
VSDMALSLLEAPPRKKSLGSLLRWAWHSWATRSLAVGALATGMDIMILLVCVRSFGLPNPVGAAIGVSFGATFTFFANKRFAFRDHRPTVGPQMAKFAGATAGSMLLHASFVGIMADRLGVPVVLAKIIADVAVFSVGQLLLLRYLVFPKAKPEPVTVQSVPPEQQL